MSILYSQSRINSRSSYRIGVKDWTSQYKIPTSPTFHTMNRIINLFGGTTTSLCPRSHFNYSRKICENPAKDSHGCD